MMNPDKARELFSDYREGLLSASLKSSFESTLTSNSEVKAEYLHFDELLTEFEKSRDEVVEIPFDLHDKIMARIDKSIFEERRKAKASWLAGPRLWIAGGIAAAAIFGAVVSLNNSNSATESTSSIIPGQQAAGLSISTQDGALHVRHGSAVNLSVLVKEETTGKLVKKFDLNGKALDSVQQNTGQQAVLLRIESNLDSLVVAVPGHERNEVSQGQGSMRDLAKTVADTFQEPVQLVTTDPEAKVVWSLDETDPLKSKGKFSIERRKGMLYLAD